MGGLIITATGLHTRPGRVAEVVGEFEEALASAVSTRSESVERSDRSANRREMIPDGGVQFQPHRL